MGHPFDDAVLPIYYCLPLLVPNDPQISTTSQRQVNRPPSPRHRYVTRCHLVGNATVCGSGVTKYLGIATLLAEQLFFLQESHNLSGEFN